MHSGTLTDDDYLEGLGIWNQIACILTVHNKRYRSKTSGRLCRQNTLLNISFVR